MQLHPTLFGRRTYDIRSDKCIRQHFWIRTRLRPGEGCQLHPRRVTQTVNVTAISWSKARSDPKTLADGPDRTDVLRTPANRLAVFCYVTFMRQAVSSSSSPSHADGAHPYTTTESWALPFRFRGLIPDRNTWPTRLSHLQRDKKTDLSPVQAHSSSSHGEDGTVADCPASEGGRR